MCDYCAPLTCSGAQFSSRADAAKRVTHAPKCCHLRAIHCESATFEQIADDGGDMSEKTILVVPGKKLTVPRPLKRGLQIAAAVALTAGVALAILVGNGLLVPRGHLLQGWDVWVTFINRTDILATMVLTALVTVLFVYWQRDQERGK
jgi:hypothetical protein